MTHPAEPPEWSPYVPPRSDSPEDIAAWRAGYDAWIAKGASANALQDTTSLLPDFVVPCAD